MRVHPGWFALVALFLMTCGDLDTFEVRKKSSTTLEKRSLLEDLIGDISFGELASFDLSESSELANQGVEKNQIDAVHLTSLSLQITAPPNGQDFTFLQSIEFYVEAPGVERRLIASGADFAAGATRVDLDVEDVDLAPYATAESMQVTTEATGSRPENDTTIEATLVLSVDVNVKGALCGE